MKLTTGCHLAATSLFASKPNWWCSRASDRWEGNAMNSADTWSDQTWDKPAGPYRHQLLASLLSNGTIKLCQPPERPSAPVIIAAAAINIHVRKTGTPPGAYRQDLFWTTIPPKSSDRPGEPCFKFIPFFAWILERTSTAPRAKLNNHHQITSNKHNLVLALNADKAIDEPRRKHPLLVKCPLLIKCSFSIKYLAFMASHSFFKHPNDLIERLVPHLAWLCWLLHSDCTRSPASAIGHA